MSKRTKPKGKKGKALRKRKVGTRDTRKQFIIVCEGEKTEPNYFKKFRVPKEIIDVIGTGANTIQVVQRAVEEKEKHPDAEVWSVFDRDSFPAQDFNNALELADRHEINVSYSNEAFEIWYLLHFHYHDVATSRKCYKEMLSDKKRMGKPYEKNDPNIFELLIDKQNNAIRNSEQLLRSYSPHNPEQDNPCTTVHKLVQSLNKFAV